MAGGLHRPAVGITVPMPLSEPVHPPPVVGLQRLPIPFLELFVPGGQTVAQAVQYLLPIVFAASFEAHRRRVRYSSTIARLSPQRAVERFRGSVGGKLTAISRPNYYRRSGLQKVSA